jgi:cation transport ATPase
MTHGTPDWFHPAWAATVRGSAEAISRSAGEIAMHGPPATPLPLDVSTRQAPPHTDPVALPSMFTMSAALGARALADNGILVTRLSAIEDAASMDVLCLDKTGTITENRLTVDQVETSGSATAHEVLRLAALEGTITTPFDMTVLNDLDRFHLVMDAIDRLPMTGDKGIYLKQQLKDKLIEHKQYINKHGQDMPEIRNWKWPYREAKA